VNEQHLIALEKANQIRQHHKQLKDELRSGKALLADALFTREPELQSIRVHDLLRATPGIGPRKTERALRKFHLTYRSPLRVLSPRDRSNLLSYLLCNCPNLHLTPERQRMREAA